MKNFKVVFICILLGALFVGCKGVSYEQEEEPVINVFNNEFKKCKKQNATNDYACYISIIPDLVKNDAYDSNYVMIKKGGFGTELVRKTLEKEHAKAFDVNNYSDEVIYTGFSKIYEQFYDQEYSEDEALMESLGLCAISEKMIFGSVEDKCQKAMMKVRFEN